MSYDQEYNHLKNDSDRCKVFQTTGNQKRRIFTVLNTNIKTIETIGDYINEAQTTTTYNLQSHKHMKERLRVFNFHCWNNKTLKAQLRTQIVEKARMHFTGNEHMFVKIIVFLLLLGMEEERFIPNINQFLSSIPKCIKRNLYTHLQNIDPNKSGPLNVDNIYMQLIITYGDEKLYSCFLTHITSNFPDTNAICSLLSRESQTPSSPVAKRIKTHQASSFKKEAWWIWVYYALQQYIQKRKMQGFRTGKSAAKPQAFLLGYVDYLEESFDDLLDLMGGTDGTTLEDLKAFLVNDLTPTERTELSRSICFGFDISFP